MRRDPILTFGLVLTAIGLGLIILGLLMRALR